MQYLKKRINFFFYFQTTIANGHAASEQSNGTVVAHAFPDAERFSVSQRIQGMVQQSRHRNDRRK